MPYKPNKNTVQSDKFKYAEGKGVTETYDQALLRKLDVIIELLSDVKAQQEKDATWLRYSE